MADRYSANKWYPPRPFAGSVFQRCGSTNCSLTSCKSHNCNSYPRHWQYCFKSSNKLFSKAFSTLFSSPADKTYKTIVRSFSIRRRFVGLPRNEIKLLGKW